MREARRTLGRWLLAAFLEGGGETRRPRPPRPVPVVRPVSREELRRIAGPLAPVVVLAPRGAVGLGTGAAGRLLPFPGAGAAGAPPA